MTLYPKSGESCKVFSALKGLNKKKKPKVEIIVQGTSLAWCSVQKEGISTDRPT